MGDPERSAHGSVAACALLLTWACGAPASAGFVPEPSQPRDLGPAGIRLVAPSNLATREITASSVTLGADGLDGQIRIDVTPTAGTGGGSSRRCANGVCERVVQAPCRTLRCAGTGDAAALADAVCASIESTFVPPRTPSLRYSGDAGGGVNCRDGEPDAVTALAAPIEALAANVRACVERSPVLPAGDSGRITFRVHNPDLDQPLVTEVGLDGLDGDASALRACLAPLVASLPLPRRRVSCGVDHQFWFEVTAEARCDP